MSARPNRLLATYLNDHLAGATVGVEMARRLRSSNEADPALGEPLAEICREIETDRATLKGAMKGLGISQGVVKPAAAWTAEKPLRLKLNGQARGPAAQPGRGASAQSRRDRVCPTRPSARVAG